MNQPNRAPSSLLDLVPGVNGLQSLDIERLRPDSCDRCGAPARGPTGRLNIYGHGIRTRLLWGPLDLDGSLRLWELQVRRYICNRCDAVRTILPEYVAKYYRYSRIAAALALVLWVVWRRSELDTRRTIAAYPVFGASDRTRWRTLQRWVGASGKLFRLNPSTITASAREYAFRLVHLLSARAPPDLIELERIVLGACST